MATRCERCGHLNDPLGSARFCEVCHAPLPGADPSAQTVRAPSPPQSPLPVSRSPAPDTEQGARSGRYPGFQRAVIAPPASRQPELPASRPPLQPLPQTDHTTIRPRDPSATTRPSAKALEGTVIRVDKLQPEPPDPDVARILFSLLLTVDLIVLLGPVALALIAVFLVLFIVAALFNALWIMTIFGFIFQGLLFFLAPLLGGLLRGRDAQRLLPVTNYLVRTRDGRAYTFRIKGRLRGAAPQQGDHVRVWGRPRHGVLRFEGGELLDTGEPLMLPPNWSTLLLILLVIANVIGFFMLRGGVSF